MKFESFYKPEKNRRMRVGKYFAAAWWLLFFAVFSGIVLLPISIFALPTTEDQARIVVQNWMALDNTPLDEALGTSVGEVETYYDDAAEPLFHIVYIEPQGFVVVAGDDLVEPIIAFVPEGIEYINSLDNPLGALVSQDLAGRVGLARAVQLRGAASVTAAQRDLQNQAAEKWQRLQGSAPLSPLDFGLSSISDVRVPSFVSTRWNQQTESGGNQCFNLYTPNNYPCGCVATAMAQIMRFWQFPTASVGTGSYTISVNGSSQSRSLLGGNGSGGAYSWALMDNGPSVSTLSHRQAIGRLTHDAGVSVNMSYASGGSGSDTLKIADRLKTPFGYSNAVKGYNSGSNISSSTRNTMTNPNLDAGYPVIFGITGSGGHAIIGDGYGYNSSTLYHHLNMGWGGYQDAWYNLPNINSSISFNSVYKVVYNIYTSGSGEIISGRVVDQIENPISGVTVTAQRSGGGSYSDTTDSRGIYAISKIPSSSSYTVSASKSGYTFSSQSTSTSTSTDYAGVGNRWGINFTASGGGRLTIGEAVDAAALPWSTSGNANWAGQTTTSYYDGDAAQSGAITHNQSSHLQTTVSGIGTISFFWRVSSEPEYDYLRFYIDGVEQTGSISGSTNWHSKTYNIATPGSHTLRWSYTKDFSESLNSDCGWVDRVVWNAGKVKKNSILKLLPAIIQQKPNTPALTCANHKISKCPIWTENRTNYEEVGRKILPDCRVMFYEFGEHYYTGTWEPISETKVVLHNWSGDIYGTYINSNSYKEDFWTFSCGTRFETDKH
jgi:hypothetical protein